MPAFRAIVAASQAADVFQTGLSLSKTLSQPPLVKPTEKWENEASATPLKAKRSKLELATGITAIGTSVLPLVAGVVNFFSKKKSLPASQATGGDQTTSPVTLATEVSEILKLLKSHAFECEHILDLSFECKRKGNYHRHGRSTDTHILIPKVSIHTILTRK